MDQVVDLDNLTRATRRREFDDGLIDFAIGALFLLLCMLNWFLFSTEGISWYAIALMTNRALTLFGLAVIAVLMIVVPLGARKAIDRIRQSTIWRDSGYVKPLRRTTGWPTILLSVVVLLGMTVGAYLLMTIGRINTEGVLRTLIASVGVGMGILYFGSGLSLGLRRYLAVGLVGGILSALILFLPVSFSIAWLILGIVWIVVLGVSGALALRQALSANADSSNE